MEGHSRLPGKSQATSPQVHQKIKTQQDWNTSIAGD